MRIVTEAELRSLFAKKEILARAASGELTTEIVKDGHPSPPKANEPICTKSQLIAYFSKDGKKLAEAHRYLRPDNTVGASGLPDPKEVLHEGVIHLLPAS